MMIGTFLSGLLVLHVQLIAYLCYWSVTDAYIVRRTNFYDVTRPTRVFECFKAPFLASTIIRHDVTTKSSHLYLVQLSVVRPILRAHNMWKATKEVVDEIMTTYLSRNAS